MAVNCNILKPNGLREIVCDPGGGQKLLKCCSFCRISFKHPLQQFFYALVFDQVKIDFVIQYLFPKIHGTFCIWEGVLPSDNKIEGDTKSPQVGALSFDLGIRVYRTLKHFWCKKHIGSQVFVERVILLITEECAHSKIYEDCLVIVVNHDVVWLNITMNNLDNFMAIMQSLQHIDEVGPRIIDFKANLLNGNPFFDTLLFILII